MNLLKILTLIITIFLGKNLLAISKPTLNVIEKPLPSDIKQKMIKRSLNNELINILKANLSKLIILNCNFKADKYNFNFNISDSDKTNEIQINLSDSIKNSFSTNPTKSDPDCLSLKRSITLLIEKTIKDNRFKKLFNKPQYDYILTISSANSLQPIVNISDSNLTIAPLILEPGIETSSESTSATNPSQSTQVVRQGSDIHSR